MQQNVLQQAVRQIQKSSSILLCISRHAKIDNMVSAVAAQKFFQALEKKAVLACEKPIWPKKLSFLKSPIFETSIEKRPLVISLDISKKRPNELSYETHGDALHIFFESLDGNFKAHDVRVIEGTSVFDLIITFGVMDLNSLGSLFTNNPKLFYETPLINIDSSSDNEGYGSIQCVDITTATTSELVFLLLHSYNANAINSSVATCLLTGIIAQTNCFRFINISPKTLQTSAELIKLGADRETIVSHLYRTRTLPILKLWCKTLSRLEHDPINHIAWSRVHKEDFLQTHTSFENLLDIVEEVVVNLPEVHAVVIFFETDEKEIRGFISLTHPHIAPHQLIQSARVSGNKRFAYFSSPHENILKAEQEIINEIRKNYQALRRES